MSHARRRLLIAPANSAGQSYAWARVAERLPGVAAANFMYRNPDDVFAYPADHSVGTVFFRTNRHWQRIQRRAVTRRFTHVIVESGRHLFGTDGAVADQLEHLQAHGVTVALLFHGSDIRLPSRHAAREINSPFRGDGYPDTAALEQIASRNRALVDATGLPVFVSTPDLLLDVPHATWLPVVVDPGVWAAAAQRPALSSRRLVVVHAPSNAGLKGSALIAETMRRLHAEGVVEYRELQHVPAAEMPAHYGAADIVLDQFALGIYGVAACEAMAAGRLVVSHVSAEKRSAVRQLCGLEVPILHSRAGNLEETLRAVAATPEAYLPLAAAGPEFVRAVHDGSRSMRVLGEFLGARPEQ